jgi:septal ring factor EnvC (AmiA/AmiB activator)
MTNARRRKWSGNLAIVLALVLAPIMASAETKDDPRRRLQQLEKDIARDREQSEKMKKRAADLNAEIETVRIRAVAAARAAQESERTLARLEGEVAALGRAEALVAGRLKARRAEIGSAVMALQRIALYPPEVLFAHPIPPSDVVRGAILLRAAVSEIERRAADVRADLDEVRASRAVAERIAARQAAAMTKLAEERRALGETLVRRTALAQEALVETKALERRLAQFAAEARGLNELMARLEVEKARHRAPAAVAAPKSGAPPSLAPSTTPFARSRGQLPMPAVGQIVIRYGQAAATGLTHRGVTLETQPGATVIAPFAGYVVFADVFRGYGQLLILDHGDGYHTLLAGLSRIDGVPGLWVETGEPVGIMGEGDKGLPRLYVEIRRGGQPFDPLPWLAAGNNKVSG